MKRSLFILLLFISPIIIKSQDQILLKDGRRIDCKIIRSDTSFLYIEVIKNDKEIKTLIEKKDVRDISYNNQVNFNSHNSNNFNDHFEFIPTASLKSRIGLSVGIGIGFENIPIGVLDNGQKASLVPGGGGVGIVYGYEFSKYIDLSINGFFENSTINQYVS